MLKHLKMGNCQEKHTQNSIEEYSVKRPSESFNAHFEQEKVNLLMKNDEMKQFLKSNMSSRVELNPSTIFTGEIYESKANGKGNIKSDKFTFQGDFVNGKPNGNGWIVFTEGKEYNGDFVNGFYHGKGVYISKDNFTYEGDFALNHFEGNGKCVWVNGDKYEGQFKNDRFEGRGVYHYADGKVFQGDFKKGVKHGDGSLTSADGSTKVSGEWDQGSIVKVRGITVDGKELPVQLIEL